jgi:hypothetical protein
MFDKGIHKMMQRRINVPFRLSPWLIVFAILCIYSASVLAASQWDPMRFVNIGTFFDANNGKGMYGYDGQFAYQIARDPLNASQYLDVPAYRYQRILYPLIAHVISFGGNPIFLPWVLILINLFSIVGGTKVTELLMLEHNQNRWYALSYGLFIGLLLSLRLDLTEALAFFWVQLAVLFFERKHLWRASFMFILASLSRELSLTFVAAAIIYLFFDKQYKRAITWGSVTLLPFIVWQVIIKVWLGEWAIRSGGMFASSFTLIPFSGWWSIASNLPFLMFLALSLVVVAPVLLPAAISIFVSARAFLFGSNNLGVWSLLINASLFPFLPTSNVMAPAGLYRVAVGLMVGVLHYGSINRSKKALNYSLLWLAALVFLYNDSVIEKVD